MKRFTLIGCIAVAAVATAASAQPPAGHGISVVAPQGSETIRTYGPDRDNRYTLEVAVADLNLASDEGAHAMRARVQRGTAMLCDVSADGPRIAGYYDSGTRHCVSDTLAAAEPQMARARQAAAEGRPVARLELSRALALH